MEGKTLNTILNTIREYKNKISIIAISLFIFFISLFFILNIFVLDKTHNYIFSAFTYSDSEEYYTNGAAVTNIKDFDAYLKDNTDDESFQLYKKISLYEDIISITTTYNNIGFHSNVEVSISEKSFSKYDTSLEIDEFIQSIGDALKSFYSPKITDLSIQEWKYGYVSDGNSNFENYLILFSELENIIRITEYLNEQLGSICSGNIHNIKYGTNNLHTSNNVLSDCGTNLNYLSHYNSQINTVYRSLTDLYAQITTEKHETLNESEYYHYLINLYHYNTPSNEIYSYQELIYDDTKNTHLEYMITNYVFYDYFSDYNKIDFTDINAEVNNISESVFSIYSDISGYASHDDVLIKSTSRDLLPTYFVVILIGTLSVLIPVTAYSYIELKNI